MKGHNVQQDNVTRARVLMPTLLSKRHEIIEFGYQELNLHHNDIESLLGPEDVFFYSYTPSLYRV